MSASFYDLLKYAATGIASPDMTYYDKMRASTLMGGVVQTLTGITPLSFKANGTPLISWSMLGNGSQTGTPTPDAPIMPTFCGVRTGNLAYARIENVNIAPSGTIVMAAGYDVVIARVENGVVYTANSYVLAFYTDEPVPESVSYNNSRIVAIAGIPTTFTAPITGYVAFRIAPSESAMLNLGGTALPYEPFGWAEKITCAGQTTPVYLGEVPTVRRVKKLVLTGTEGWNDGTSNYYVFINVSGRGEGIPNSAALSTHTESGVVVNNNGTALFFRKSVFAQSSLADFKSYIASEYAAGHPVTIWYVLANEQTGIVNEPLCKIGDYADELHSEDAGVTIPTTRGQNTLTVGTTLQPSEMTIMYRK